MNPFLRRLGFSPTDRVVVFHADDIGRCHSSLAAYADLIDFGLLSSAATMVPCAWFPATAAYCRERSVHWEAPHFDMGVDLTLTSEWSTIRWGPIQRRERASGLTNVIVHPGIDTPELRAMARSSALPRGRPCPFHERGLAASRRTIRYSGHRLSCLARCDDRPVTRP